MGHAYEIAGHSGVCLQIEAEKLPFVERAREAAEAKCFPGGTFRNRKHYECIAAFGHSIPEQQILMMFSPETSGGLLATVDACRGEELRGLFEANNQEVWPIGEVVEGSGLRVTV